MRLPSAFVDIFMLSGGLLAYSTCGCCGCALRPFRSRWGLVSVLNNDGEWGDEIRGRG